MLIAQVFAVVAVPVITRLYSPQDYGYFGVFMAFSGMMYVIAALRYEKAIIIAEEQEVPALMRLSALAIMISSSLFMGVMLLFGGGLELMVIISSNTSMLYLISVSILLNGFLLLFISLGNKRREYAVLAVTMALHSIISNSLKILFGILFTSDAIGLVLAEIIGVLLSLLYILWRIGIGAFRDSHEMRPELTLPGVAIRYLKFFRYDVFNSFFSNLYWLLPTFILAFYFSSEVIGLYVLAYSMFRIPVNLFGKAVEDVFYRQSVAGNKMVSLPEQTQRVLSILFRVGLLPVVAVVLYGDILFSFVFGLEWESAGRIARILVPLAFLWLLSLPLNTIFNTLQSQEKLFSFVMLGTVVRIAALVIGGEQDNMYLSMVLFSLFGVTIYLFQFMSAFRILGLSIIRGFSVVDKKNLKILVAVIIGFCLFLIPVEKTIIISVTLFIFTVIEISILKEIRSA